MKKLSEKQRIIQEQAKLTKENEKEISTDAPSAKDKAILAAAEKLEQKERAYADMFEILYLLESSFQPRFSNLFLTILSLQQSF